MKEKLYVVMPAYNEEANIESVARAWYGIVSGKNADSRLVIADSGSTDRTHEILENLQKEMDQLEILENTEKQHGPKVIALYDHAIKCGADYIFQTDSDGQTDPGEFEDFLSERNNYSGIFGNRTVRGDGRDRAFVEKIVCVLLRIYFGIKIPDANAPFRLMRSDVVKKYLYNMSSDYNLPNIMMTTYFVYYSENYTFKRITFRPRAGGQNSIDIPRIIKIGMGALVDFWKFRKNIMK